MGSTGPSPDSLYTVPAIINNKDCHFKTTFPVYAPATGVHLHNCANASVYDANVAAKAAQDAYPAWRNTKPGEKRRLFLKAAEVLESRAEELGKYMIDEAGAPEFWGAGFNVPLATDIIRDVAGRIPTIVGSIPTAGEEGTSALVVKEPYGVVLAIAPW